MTLVVSHISKSYGENTVLSDINFSISPNEIVGLLGKNGAGKTTLLKILAGISTNHDGTVVLNKSNDLDLLDYKKKVGYMSEKNPLYPDMYVTEYIQWIAETFKLSNVPKRVEEVIIDAGLSDMKTRKIGELSKGYKQRVGLAAAIVHDPQLLVLDEPINGLDPAQILQYRALIKRLSKDRIIVLSSHLMQEIDALCSRIILIEEGSIAKDDLLHNTSNQQQNQSLYIQLNKDRGEFDWSAVTGIIELQELGESKYVLHYGAKSDPRKTMMETLTKQGRYILEMREYKEELDKLFY